MKNPPSLFPTPRGWSARVSAVAAVVLLVILIGGLTAGLILVRRGSTTGTQATKTPVATATPPITPTSTPAPSGIGYITSITMKDASTGWATGYENLEAGAPTQILHTSDGGITWKNVTPHPSGLLAQSGYTSLHPLSNGAGVRTEDFITGLVAWELVLPNQFFKTTDGGQTWQPETAPGESMRQFTFLDEHTGWVITEDGGRVVVFRTTDGGVTWTKMQQGGAAAFPSADAFWGVRFLNETTGWAAYINNSVGQTASIYVTHDSGATWQHQSLPLPKGATAPIFPSPPVFFNATDGVMVVDVPSGIAGQIQPHTTNRPASGGAPEVVYVTHNGGTTWEGPIVLPLLGFPPTFSDVAHGWAIKSGSDGLLATSDSGRHWTTVNTSSNFFEISNISFISNQTGWALKNNPDSGGFLLRTDDGGHTWQQLPTQITS